LASRIRFGFEGFDWTFGKALRTQEWAVVLGSCSFRESREKNRSSVRLARKGRKPSGGRFFFPRLASVCSERMERLTWI